MSRIPLFVLAAALLSGCSNRPAPSHGKEGVHIGMKDNEAISVMRPKSLDWGCVYWGGSGASRLYFQLNTTQQVWLEISGSPDFAVTAISKPEPKAKWTHFSGDSITVD